MWTTEISQSGAFLEDLVGNELFWLWAVSFGMFTIGTIGFSVTPCAGIPSVHSPLSLQVHLVYTVYESSSSCLEWCSTFWHILDVMVTALSYVYIVFVILYVDKLGSFSFSSGKQVSAYMSCFVPLIRVRCCVCSTYTICFVVTKPPITLVATFKP